MHERELECFVLGNLLSDWRCGEFRTGKSSSNYSANRFSQADKIRLPVTNLDSLLPIGHHSYSNTHAAASTWVLTIPFMCMSVPLSSVAGNLGISRNNSAYRCQNLHLQKPCWGLWSQALAPGTHWCLFTCQCLQNANTVQTCKSVCRLVLLYGKREHGKIHTYF